MIWELVHFYWVVPLWIYCLVWVVYCAFRSVDFCSLPASETAIRTFFEGGVGATNELAADGAINFLGVFFNYTQRKIIIDTWWWVCFYLLNLPKISKLIWWVTALCFLLILEGKNELIGSAVFLFRFFDQLFELNLLETSHGFNPVIRFLTITRASITTLRTILRGFRLSSLFTTTPFLLHWLVRILI